MQRQQTLPGGGDIYTDSPNNEKSRQEPSGPGAQHVGLREKEAFGDLPRA